MKPTTKSKLERLLKKWRKMEREFSVHSQDRVNIQSDERNRCEGIATAYRWCRDDIHKIIDEL